MFFWCIAFGVGCEQLIMSTTVACWYFQDDHKVNGSELKSPNAEKTDEKTDKKQNDEFVTNGFKQTFKQHLGSVAMGSFMVAVVQTARVMLEAQTEQVNKMGGDNPVVKCQLKCAACCLACMEKCIRWVNRKAQIVIAICGGDFWPAVCGAVKKVITNWDKVFFASIAAEFFGLLGSLMITVMGPGVVYLMITNLKTTPFAGYEMADLTAPMFMLLVLVLLGYGFAAVFVGIFEMCMETILFAYIFDDKETYQPESFRGEGSMKSVVDESDKKMKERNEKKANKDTNNV